MEHKVDKISLTKKKVTNLMVALIVSIMTFFHNQNLASIVTSFTSNPLTVNIILRFCVHPFIIDRRQIANGFTKLDNIFYNLATPIRIYSIEVKLYTIPHWTFPTKIKNLFENFCPFKYF